MDTAKDAAAACFGGSLTEAGVTARDVGKPWRCRCEGLIVSEVACKDPGGGCTVGTMPRDVFWMGRCDQQR